jgi:hypothetical protein
MQRLRRCWIRPVAQIVSFRRDRHVIAQWGELDSHASVSSMVVAVRDTDLPLASYLKHWFPG